MGISMSVTILPLLPSTSPILPTLPPALPPEPVMRLSVEQFHLMIDAGLFANDDGVELLEGWLMPKMPKKPEHPDAVENLREAFSGLLPPGWFIRCQDPITTEESEPEPDVAVIRGKRSDYRGRHPRSKDAGLVVEVSDTTLARDRGVKKRIYARAAIPIYWIVNLQDRCIEVYTDPTGPAEQPDYQQPRVYGENEFVPVVLDGQVIGQVEVKQLLL
jgi:Uma2 family endonuclease